jgi:hypothetical protein
MAAITAAEQGLAGVLLLEATPQPLGKVLISGGGRCNVSHACWDPLALVGHYPRGSRALRGPFSRFATGDCLAWFAERGLELVEEPDGRLFPRSNRSSSVVAVLEAAAAAAGVTVWRGASLRQVDVRAGGGFQLTLRLAAGLDGPGILAEGWRVRREGARVTIRRGVTPWDRLWRAGLFGWWAFEYRLEGRLDEGAVLRGRILVGVLPWRQAVLVSRVEPWGFFIVMALVLTGLISAWWMQPLMGLTFDFLKLTLSPLATLLR